MEGIGDAENGIPPTLDESRHRVRRKADISAGEALGVLASKASGLQHLIVLMLLIGGGFGAALVWLGYKQQSPADAIHDLQHQLDVVRAEGAQRDSVMHSVARSVALLTYYRCSDENAKVNQTGKPVIDCIKLLQDGDK